MIVDRTKSDIDAALLARAKLQNGEELSESDFVSLERGTLTIETLNRIESKIKEIVLVINSMWYWNTGAIQEKTWPYSDYFKQEDFDKILENIAKIKNAFLQKNSTPKVFGRNYRDYNVINDVEMFLADSEYIIDDIQENYVFCGEAECGGDS